MKVVELVLSNFRAYSDFRLQPRTHVGLVGPPGSGSTALLDALTLVLDPDSTRTRPPDELEFHRGDLTQPILIEATLADLGEPLEQHFLPHTEPWDAAEAKIMSELEASLADRTPERILRLGYRAAWSDHEERVDQQVYYAKGAQPLAGIYDVPRRADRELLPFVRVGPPGTALSLAERSTFRQLVETANADDLHGALEETQSLLQQASEILRDTEQVDDAVTRTTSPVSHLLPLYSDPAQAITFVPGGTTTSSLLRSLIPHLHTPDGVLPLSYTGSTNAAILALMQSLALIGDSSSVITVDDLGEQLDAGSARHLFSLLLGQAAQAWIATRRPDIAEALDPEHLVRLYGSQGGARGAAQLPSQQEMNRSHRITLKHVGPQLLQASTGESVVIVEGPDDANTLQTLSHRLIMTHHSYGLNGIRSKLIHPGLMQESGGHQATSRLADVAKYLQLRTVIILDGDTQEQDVANATAVAHGVVRLPDGYAIERLLLHGIQVDQLRDTLQALIEAFQLDVAFDYCDMDRVGREVLKSKGRGLHSSFIEALPSNVIPPLGAQLIRSIIRAAGGYNGLIQLSPDDDAGD